MIFDLFHFNSNSWQNTYSSLANTAIPKKRNQDDNTLIRRHGGVLGLCSLIESSPYGIAEWMPETLMKLAPFVNDPVPIKDTVKRTFAEFRRTHLDTWLFDQKKFTEEQLYAINELLISPTYYA